MNAKVLGLALALSTVVLAAVVLPGPDSAEEQTAGKAAVAKSSVVKAVLLPTAVPTSTSTPTPTPTPHSNIFTPSPRTRAPTRTPKPTLAIPPPRTPVPSRTGPAPTWSPADHDPTCLGLADLSGGGGGASAYGARVPISLTGYNAHDLASVSLQVVSNFGPAGSLVDVTYTGATVVVPVSGQGSMFVFGHVRFRSRLTLCLYKSDAITFPIPPVVVATSTPRPTPAPTAIPTGAGGGYVCVGPQGIIGPVCP